MCIISAILWEPSKSEAHISYMLLDSELRVLHAPERKSISRDDFESIDRILENFFNTINKHSQLENVIIQYKSVIKRSPNHSPREDSKYFDKKINEFIPYFKQGDRLQSKLTGQGLKKFQSALLKAKLIPQVRGNAWKVHLWAVAMHTTPSSLNNSIDRISMILNKDHGYEQ